LNPGTFGATLLGFLWSHPIPRAPLERDFPTPSPSPGLVAENIRQGRWLFRHRSYAPLIPLTYILVLTAFGPVPPGGAGALPWWRGAGIVLGFLGLAVRAWTLGVARAGTSSRGTVEPRAAALSTDGPYSVARHPLYLGNLLLWMGVAVLSGHPVGVAVTPLVFWIYYEKIMMAEERFLFEEFGPAYGEWVERTPAMLPRLTAYTRSSRSFSARVAMFRDYQAPYAFIAATTAVEVARSLGSGGLGFVGPGWAVYFVAGTLAYFGVNMLRRRG
jgi:protein-S-isoprenylcysteine O-methyltransferase Ste14